MPDHSESGQHWLLTPGPLTTSPAVRQAMQRDWGSWDADFLELTASIRRRLLAIAGQPESTPATGSDRDASQEIDCVPVQGSGTFVVEAMLGSFVPHDGKVLVLSNGAYGQRVAKTLAYLGRAYTTLDKGDYLPPRGAEVAQILQQDADITHVVVVHCETSSGILNPLQEIADTVHTHGRKLLIDSMSAFGALPIDHRSLPFEALVSSANKCIEGVPGFGFLIARKSAIEQTKGRSHSLALDIYEQWDYMEKTGQWRFTPPTHSVAAFDQALRLHTAEGGAPGRLARYTENCRVLTSSMRAAGFETLLTEPWISPIIVTFFNPADPGFKFEQFYNLLKEQGFIIYPGKLTVVDSFRVGCIGDFDAQVMRDLTQAASQALTQMQVRSASPSSEALRERARLAG